MFDFVSVPLYNDLLMIGFASLFSILPSVYIAMGQQSLKYTESRKGRFMRKFMLKLAWGIQ
jgi:hypothetical protein